MISMLRIAAALSLLLLLLSAPAHAWIAQKPAAAITGGQILVAGAGTNAVGTADRYFPVGYAGGLASSTLAKTMTFPVPGTLRAMLFHANTAPAGAAKYTGTVMINGSASAVTCDVTSSSTNGTCTFSGSVGVSAGDTASFLVHPTGSPTNSFASASILFIPTTTNDTILPNSALALSNSATQAQVPFGSHNAGAPNFRRNVTMPDGGTVDKMFVVSNAPGTAASGMKYNYTYDKATTPQTLTCEILEVATSCSDTSNSFTVAAGDDLQLQAAPTATPTAADAAFGARYLPTTAGRFMFGMSPSVADSATVVTYYPIAGSGGVGQTTEANAQVVLHATTLEKMQIKLSAAPGTGETRRFTVRKNGVDQTNCDVVDTATTAACTISVAFADGDLFSLADNPLTQGDGVNPAAATPGVSFLATR